MIRKGEERDICAVRAIECEVFCDPWREEDIRTHLCAPHLVFLVREEEGRVCGYLLGSSIPPEGEIFRVASAPFARRQGGAEALCREFFTRTETCYLEVRRGNTAARTLYEKLGFSLIGERRDYYKNPTEDACLYRRM